MCEDGGENSAAHISLWWLPRNHTLVSVHFPPLLFPNHVETLQQESKLSLEQASGTLSLTVPVSCEPTLAGLLHGLKIHLPLFILTHFHFC